MVAEDGVVPGASATDEALPQSSTRRRWFRSMLATAASVRLPSAARPVQPHSMRPVDSSVRRGAVRISLITTNPRRSAATCSSRRSAAAQLSHRICLPLRRSAWSTGADDMSELARSNYAQRLAVLAVSERAPSAGTSVTLRSGTGREVLDPPAQRGRARRGSLIR